MIPLKIVGRMVLNRNPGNFFAETEQVAFCVGNVVPGIDFSNDPLLQGRLFSYLDTQLKRLGGPNFHQIPINAPKCPFANYQRDGHMQIDVPLGRVNYEPNSFAPEAAREVPQRGFRSFPTRTAAASCASVRALFADHFTQARMFFLSQTDIERDHIVAALIFELSKVETPAIRARVVSQLLNIDDDLGARVSAGLGLSGVAAAKPAMERKDMDPSPALSILKKAKPTLKGRTIGLMVSDGADAATVNALRKAAQSAGAKVKVVAETIAGAELSGRQSAPGRSAHRRWSVELVRRRRHRASDEGASRLARMGAAQDFVRDAFAHLKTIAFTDNLSELFAKAGLKKADLDEACIALAKRADAERFIDTAAKGKLWSREPKVRPLP